MGVVFPSGAEGVILKTLKIIVPTPLVGGGGTIYSNRFFVQSVLADRYIHRREM